MVDVLEIDSAELLTTTEAAVVASVSVRDVNRVIDEGILPREFVNVAQGRRVLASGCALISFYFESAKRLTSEVRLWAIRNAASRLRTAMTAKLLNENWTFKDEFVTIDLAPFLHKTWERGLRLKEARAMVTISPEILSGEPVIGGTRIPVYDVAASVSAAVPMDRILAAYPSLSAEQVELAVIYADAIPLRGRPRLGGSALPEGAVIIADRRIPRHGKAV